MSPAEYVKGMANAARHVRDPSMALLIPFAALLAVAATLATRPAVAWLHGLLAARLWHLPPPSPADAAETIAVVLGYALFRNGSITEPLKGRVFHGVKAVEQGLARGIVFSGAHPGQGIRGRSEASAMIAYALQLTAHPDVPNTWHVEDRSTSTRENAIFTLQIASQHGWQHLLVVTNTFHQLRSFWTFQKAARDLGMPDVQITVAQVPFVGHAGWWGSAFFNTVMDHIDFWRELAALAYYKMRGFI